MPIVVSSGPEGTRVEVIPPQDPPPWALRWATMNKSGTWAEAWLGTQNDGVRFTLSHFPTCHRRGQWRLLVEVMGAKHTAWGCFDDQDQPMRWYTGRVDPIVVRQYGVIA